MNGCICWPLAEVQAHFIADGDPPTDAMLKAVFASVQRLGLAERCPDHPHNWRITNNGLVGLVVEAMRDRSNLTIPHGPVSRRSPRFGGKAPSRRARASRNAGRRPGPLRGGVQLTRS